MEIIRLEKGHLDEALRLVWDTFLRFEAPTIRKKGSKPFTILFPTKTPSALRTFSEHLRTALFWVSSP